MRSWNVDVRYAYQQFVYRPLVVDGSGSCDATLSLSMFTARKRLTYGSRSLSTYVGGCSIFVHAIYSRWLPVQVKGMMTLEWNRWDVLAKFRSGKNSQMISVHAVVNQLAPRKFFNQRSLCSTHNMILSWNMLENHVGRISRVN